MDPSLCPSHRSACIHRGFTFTGVAFTKNPTRRTPKFAPHIFSVLAIAPPLLGELDEGVSSLWLTLDTISAVDKAISSASPTLMRVPFGDPRYRLLQECMNWTILTHDACFTQVDMVDIGES